MCGSLEREKGRKKKRKEEKKERGGSGGVKECRSACLPICLMSGANSFCTMIHCTSVCGKAAITEGWSSTVMSKRGREREEADVKHAAVGGKTGESQSCRACCSYITLVCVAILKLEDTGLTALRKRPEGNDLVR